MNIYALLLVKNEDDIISEVIKSTLEWADKLYVIDNGSNDLTYQKINKLSKKNSKIINLGQIYVNFNEGLRTIIWETIRSVSKENDWWAFIDSDEFFYDNVRYFLKKIPKHYGCVATTTCEFLPTINEKEKFEKVEYFDKNIFTYYKSLDWAESRFFRYSNKLKYASYNERFPKIIRAMYPIRIKTLHYPLRNKKQIEKRLKTRKEVIKLGFKGWKHASQNNWIEKLYDPLKDGLIKFEGLDKLYWNMDAKNFKPNSLNFKLRTNVKILMYYLNLI